MEQSADIYELNTVRKHLSAIKGGQLAAAGRGGAHARGSDVVGDDLSVIASGPTVADDSTYAQALDILDVRGGPPSYPRAVVDRLQRGADGRCRKPRSRRRAAGAFLARVIGPQRGAIEGAEAQPGAGLSRPRGSRAVTGEARTRRWRMCAGCACSRALAAPLCVISSGETTVTVRGTGRGGRNQEFALAMARVSTRSEAALRPRASAPTASMVQRMRRAPSSIRRRCARPGSRPGAEAFLNDNNTYVFFERLRRFD
jgi:hydroxypyruvate reductase